MEAIIAKGLFDLQQKVADKALYFAMREEGKHLKSELTQIAEKAVEIQKLLIVHMPKD